MSDKKNSSAFRKSVIPSMLRRMHGYDYTQPGYYMVTIMLSENIPYLSKVVGRPFIPSTYLRETDLAFRANIELSETGRLVSEQVRALPARFPVEVKCSVIMPDHLHLLINVTEEFPRKLGGIISSLKGACSRSYWEACPTAKDQSFWQQGYNDKPLYGRDSLPRFFNYIKDNPWRYLIRKAMPEYFYRRWQFDYDGRKYHVIGNIFLLQYPVRLPVRFSRKFSAAELERRNAGWLAAASRGDVLISTSIHPFEKSVTRECVAAGARLIWLRTNGLPARSIVKGERAYELCAQGKLLMIAPAEYSTSKETLTRDCCIRLNNLAEYLAAHDITPVPCT